MENGEWETGGNAQLSAFNSPFLLKYDTRYKNQLRYKAGL